MASGDPVSRLLAALRASGSPAKRMRVLARAWRALRRMDLEQRKRLAAEVGAEGAEELLEQLADRGSGVKPALLMQALEGLRGSDPSELLRVVDAFRRPEGRRDLVERGLDAVRRAVEPPPEPAPYVEPPPIPAEPVSKAPPVSAEPVADAPPPRRVEPGPRPAPAPVPVRRAEPAARSSPACDPRRLLDRVAGESGPLRRLSLLRQVLDELRGWPPERIGDLLELYAAGWARRRALAAIFEAGIPDDRHGAVFLLEKLESPISRRWCLRTLLRRPGWSDREREILAGRFDPRGGRGRPEGPSISAL